MTVRHALLPAAAVLVLGVGVYLFVEVRAQPAPPAMPRDRAPRPVRTEMPQVAAPPSPPAPAVAARNATDRAPRPADPVERPVVPPAPVLAPVPGDELVGPTLDAAMAEANGAYDRGDLEDARMLASRVLARYPTNVRMLRIMVSATCIEGDHAAALTHYAKLPTSDQAQMKIRCARYGVTFPDR